MSFAEKQIFKRSLEDKVQHLEKRIDMLKTLPRSEGKEALRRADMELASVKQSLSAVCDEIKKASEPPPSETQPTEAQPEETQPA